MKIKNIKINNYGNLENKEINLENKINIIYGKNESGKSTLLNYIKNIFYGISKNKNGKDVSDYEKYKPWRKEEFSGKLKYELNNGENFEVFRDFNKKNPKVFNGNLEDISKEFYIDKKDGSQFFYEQTKVDEMMFLSTIVSMQQEVKLDKQSQQILVQKIANLAGTGDDNISFKKVLDKLNKRQVDEIGTDRTQGKPINQVKERMKNIEFVIKDMNSCQNSKIELEEKKRTTEEKNSNLILQEQILKRLNEINMTMKVEQEKMNISKKMETDIEQKIYHLNIEKNNLIENKKEILLNYEKIEKNRKELIDKENKKDNRNLENKKINSRIKNNKNKLEKNKIENKIKYAISFFILFILFIIINLLNLFFIKNNYFYYFNILFIPIYFIYLLIQNIVDKNKKKKIEYVDKLNRQIKEEKMKNEINIIDTKIEAINHQIEQLNKEKSERLEEIKSIQLHLDEKLDHVIQETKEKYKQKISIEEMLDHLNLNDVQNNLNQVQEELNQNRLLLQSIELEEKNIVQKLENMISLKEEYKNLQEKLQELEDKSMCMILTKEYLNRAYEKMKRVVTPKFTENLSKGIEEITNQKYTKVILNDENGLIVENDYGEYIPVDRLSIGTIDQLYLSLRLSMIDEISEENMPIILDEAFAFYDEFRLENILKFLAQQSENHQLIIFTCTQREKNIFDKIGVPYNLVELS